MTDEPRFISLEDALFFHSEEVRRTGNALEIRDVQALVARKAVFDACRPIDPYEMAATYVQSI